MSVHQFMKIQKVSGAVRLVPTKCRTKYAKRKHVYAQNGSLVWHEANWHKYY